MTSRDLDQLRLVGRHLQDFERIGLLSPVRRRSRRTPWRENAVSEIRVFPTATALSRHDWDLNERGHRQFDLLVASSVFMYSPSPARWFDNVLQACAYFLMIDLVRRRRSTEHEFGTDGDCMRYAVDGAQPRVREFFALESLGDRLLAFRAYPGGANEYDASPVHVIALFRGERADAERPPAVRSAIAELESAPADEPPQPAS